jgi:hypothetical protein
LQQWAAACRLLQVQQQQQQLPHQPANGSRRAALQQLLQQTQDQKVGKQAATQTPTCRCC